MVTHPGANHGPSCLTSEISQKLVFQLGNAVPYRIQLGKAVVIHRCHCYKLECYGWDCLTVRGGGGGGGGTELCWGKCNLLIK